MAAIIIDRQEDHLDKILVYTIHKAGSMFLHKITSEASEAFGLDYYSINKECHYDLIKQNGWNCLIEDASKTGCFGPIRVGEALPNIPSELGAYTIILHLRDPRDILTSAFFSCVYSHPRQEGRFNISDEQRGHLQERGIDAFVIERTPNLKSRYETLCNALFGKDNVRCIKYEDMVTDYKHWLEEYLSAFRHLARSQTSFSGIVDDLYNRHKDEFNVDSEDIFRHKRQVTPGDHKQKLTPQTIEWLNREFDNILRLLQYN